jgi:hypothetical protein
MPVSNSRNRLVVFRLTQDEYDALKGACTEKGGRNLSEFTRTELLTGVRSESLDDLLRERFGELEKRLEALRGSVTELADRLSGAPAPAAGVPPLMGGEER